MSNEAELKRGEAKAIAKAKSASMKDSAKNARFIFEDRNGRPLQPR